MKRTYLYFIAVFFICAIAALSIGVKAYAERTTLPAFSQKYEWSTRIKRPISPYFAP
jgi:hypothetical protein